LSDDAGAVVNAFAEVSAWAQYGGNTYSFAVSYTGGTGNDVVLNAVPMGTMILVR